MLANYGIFVNEWTLEASLVDSGFTDHLLEALDECGGGPRVVATLRRHASLGLDIRDGLIRQIESVGKGRVAQRLSAQVMDLEPMHNDIPDYIKDAIEYLVGSLDATVGIVAEDTETTHVEEEEIPF